MKNIFLIVIPFFLLYVSCDEVGEDAGMDEVQLSQEIEALFSSLDTLELGNPIRGKRIASYSTSLVDESLPVRKEKLKALAYFLYKQGDTKDYLNIEHQVQAVALTHNDSFTLATSICFEAEYYRQKKIRDSAFSKYYDGAKIFEAIGENQEAGLKWLTMAIIQKRVKDYAGSEASSIKALELLLSDLESDNKETGLRYIASTYNNLGIVAKEREQYKLAIFYYNEALNFRKQIDKNDFLAAGTYNNIGLVYANSGEYDKAVAYYDKGLSNDLLFESRPKTYARLLDNKAFAMHKSGSNATLDSLFFKSLHIREALSDISGIGTSNYHIAQYKADKGFKEDAELYALIALENAKKADNIKVVLEALELLTAILPPEKALDYAQELISLSKEIEKSNMVYQDQFARVRFETETLLSANKRVTRNFRQLTIAFLFTLVLVLLGYIWKQRLSSKKGKIYQRAQQKSTEEIYSLMLAQSAKIEEGKQLEKKRISEELHDNVLSKLFGIRISLDSVHDKEGEEVVKARAGYLKNLKDVTQEIRQISHDLSRDNSFRHQLFPDVLDDLITDFGERREVNATLTFDKNIHWNAIEDTTKAHLYRIIQESLANAYMHGMASNIDVSFIQDDTHITTIIADDGVGIDLKGLKKGIGLKNIASRTEQISGEFYFLNRDPKGAAIEIRFPKKIKE